MAPSSQTKLCQPPKVTKNVLVLGLFFSDSFGLHDNIQHRTDRVWQKKMMNKMTVFTLLWRHCSQKKLGRHLHMKGWHQLHTVHQLGLCVSTKHWYGKHKVHLSSTLWSPVLCGPGTPLPIECNNVDMQSWFYSVLPASLIFLMIGKDFKPDWISMASTLTLPLWSCPAGHHHNKTHNFPYHLILAASEPCCMCWLSHALTTFRVKVNVQSGYKTCIPLNPSICL